MRPRHGRIVAALSALSTTAVALLGAAGLIPLASGSPASGLAAGASGEPPQAAVRLSAYTGPTMMRRPEPGRRAPDALPLGQALPVESDELPVRTGTGKRVVFDMSAQRVWLVDGKDRVRRTYLVSGSLTDNLKPGTYEVYSTSRHAVGIDDSGTMQYMVRFAYGERAAIGFHDIPVDDGKPVQTRAELGTPQSHGCIRQWRADAKALWSFAILGTKVVVTA